MPCVSLSLSDHLKAEKELAQEKQILNEMLEVVEQRDALVALLEEQRLREKEEDKDLESVMLSKGFNLNWAWERWPNLLSGFRERRIGVLSLSHASSFIRHVCQKSWHRQSVSNYHTRSSECVKITPDTTHRNTPAAADIEAVVHVYISTAHRQPPLIHSAVSACSLSLCKGERRVFFFPPQLYHHSLEVDPLKCKGGGGGGEEGGALGECLKTCFILDYLKGRVQFGPADVKGTVKSCVFCVQPCRASHVFSRWRCSLLSLQTRECECVCEWVCVCVSINAQSDCRKDILCWSCLSIQWQTDVS